MSFGSVSELQKKYIIIERGWFTDTVRSVSKNEFLQHQQSQPTFSINTIIKTLAVGILGASQSLRSAQVSQIGTQMTFTALSCYLWSQIPQAAAQTTTSTTFAPASTAALGPQGNEFQVNTYRTNNQSDPSVAAFSGGSFVVTWTSDGQDGNRTGIYGQMYGVSGTKAGREFQVNTYTTGFPGYTSVASLVGGGFVVAWVSDMQDASKYEIYGQKCDATGSKSGSEFRINNYTSESQSNPSLAAFNDGGFIVTWQSFGQDGSGLGVYGQRYDAAATKVGIEFKINTYTTNYQSRPSVAALSGGGFIVTWDSFGQDGSGLGVYGQRYTTAGARVGSEFQINTYTTNDQDDPSVAALSGGGFVVTWTSDGQDGDLKGIYGQRYDEAGTKVESEFQINTYTTNKQDDSNVAALNGGRFVVTWSSFGQDGSGSSVYGQRYDAAGMKVGSEFQINIYTINDQGDPIVAALSSEEFVVAWSSHGQDGSGYGIFGRIFPGNSTSTTHQTPTSPLNTTNLTTNTLVTQATTTNSTKTKTTGSENTGQIPYSTTESTVGSVSNPTAFTLGTTSSSGNNTPLIAGLAGGIGALACFLVSGVVFFLRQRSKNKAAPSDPGIDLPALTPHGPPPSAKTVKSPSNQYEQIPIRSHQIDQNGYKSARFDAQPNHYSDANDWIKELKQNPPQAIYGGADELERLNDAMSSKKDDT